MQDHSGLDGMHVVEIGCGTGLCSLASASAGAVAVTATDVDPISLKLTAAAAAAQGFASVETLAFDVTSTSPLPPGDALILSDLFVTAELASAHASRVAEALMRGLCVFVVDPGRTSRQAFLDELARCGVSHRGFERLCDFGSIGDALHPVDVTHTDGITHTAAMRPLGRLALLDTDEGAPVSFEI